MTIEDLNSSVLLVRDQYLVRHRVEEDPRRGLELTRVCAPFAEAEAKDATRVVHHDPVGRSIGYPDVAGGRVESDVGRICDLTVSLTEIEEADPFRVVGGDPAVHAVADVDPLAIAGDGQAVGSPELVDDLFDMSIGRAY